MTITYVHKVDLSFTFEWDSYLDVGQVYEARERGEAVVI